MPEPAATSAILTMGNREIFLILRNIRGAYNIESGIIQNKR